MHCVAIRTDTLERSLSHNDKYCCKTTTTTRKLMYKYWAAVTALNVLKEMIKHFVKIFNVLYVLFCCCCCCCWFLFLYKSQLEKHEQIFLNTHTFTRINSVAWSLYGLYGLNIRLMNNWLNTACKWIEWSSHDGGHYLACSKKKRLSD